jgi:DNA-directed RNA polymerase specialized sigma24 family protein
LAAEDAQCAELVKLRFFAGLSNVEAARMLGLSERTAKRTWAYARTRLFEELQRCN